MTFGAVNFGNGIGDEEWRQSFDLNAAITDLLNDHDELHRRRQLRDRAASDASELGANVTSKPSSRLRSDSLRHGDESLDSSRVQGYSARNALASEGQRGGTTSSRRERLTSSAPLPRLQTRLSFLAHPRLLPALRRCHATVRPSAANGHHLQALASRYSEAPSPWVMLITTRAVSTPVLTLLPMHCAS